ncbi:MAG: PQQ-dependent sugar dehydrogenase, partial [Patescibacteria group bacterium]
MEPEGPLQQSDNIAEPQVQVPGSRPGNKLATTAAVILVLLVLVIGGVVWWKNGEGKPPTAANASKSGAEASRSTEDPTLTTETVVDGQNAIWDMTFLPTKEMLFTERAGTLNVLKDDKVQMLARISDVYAQGEGGLLGLVVDPIFASNHYIYTCFNTNIDIRVVRWVLKTDLSGIEKRKDIITGAPRNLSGRHSGCRMAFGPDGYLWVGTGDTAQNRTPQTPQDPKSLGGKILRVDRDGRGVSGNLGGTFDPRIYSYGHRNTQGIA